MASCCSRGIFRNSPGVGRALETGAPSLSRISTCAPSGKGAWGTTTPFLTMPATLMDITVPPRCSRQYCNWPAGAAVGGLGEGTAWREDVFHALGEATAKLLFRHES